MFTQLSLTVFSKMGILVAAFLMMLVCLPTHGVYVRERRRELLREAGEQGGDRRGSRGEGRPQDGDSSADSGAPGTSRRDPFQRILVLCNHDDECDRRYFCHGGEGHKSCLPCRRTRRRCQRNGMCCHGNVCRQGRCVPKELRYDASYAKTSPFDADEEESISQHTRDNMRRLREDEVCETSDQCGHGLCCAQHFWTRVCKPILVKGDLCTKKRDRHTDFFQRCQCGPSLACKRHPSPDIRYHTCQVMKESRRTSVKEDNPEDGVILTVNHEEGHVFQLEVQLSDDPSKHGSWDDQETDKTAGAEKEAVDSDYESQDQSASDMPWRDNEVKGEDDGAQRSEGYSEARSSSRVGEQPVTEVIAAVL